MTAYHLVAVLSALFAALPAYAVEINKCVVDGKTIYQEEPCAKKGQVLKINSEISQERIAEASERASKEKYQAAMSGIRQVSKDTTRSQGNPSTVQSSSGTSRYPYAREGDIERLKADNKNLQASMKQMKDKNPDWQHSQTLKRLNDQAEALNKRIQE